MIPEKPRLPDIPWRAAKEAVGFGFTTALDRAWVYSGKPDNGAELMALACPCGASTRVEARPYMMSGKHFSVWIYIGQCAGCGTMYWWNDDPGFAKRVFKEEG